MSLWLLLVMTAAAALCGAYCRAPLWLWTAGAAILGVWLSIPELIVALGLERYASGDEGWPQAAMVAAWIVFAAVALLLNLPALRRRVLTRHAFSLYRRVLPPMSTTEREAIEAGTVWWDAQLFSGRPDWRQLLAVPPPRLSDEEQAFLDGPVEVLCAMLDDWEITFERQDLPPEVWTFLKRNGFFGMIIPKRYGGLEFSALGHSAVVTKIASRSVSASVTVMVPNSLGPAELLLRYGTQAQREHYLPRLARGDEVPCFALTGPEAGSDASAIPDAGIVCRGRFASEDDVLGIRLSWEKRYITLGPVATLLGLAFKLEDPDHLLGPTERPGITVALIPTDTPGIEIGDRHRVLNQAFQNGPNRGQDVFIPVEWIIGGPEMAGQGWRMLMESLAAGRSISLPALSTGSTKLASRATGAYAAIREQFRTAVGQFEGVQEALARIGGNTYVVDAARTLTAMALDGGEQPSVISAIVKYHLTERMRQVVNDAMDVHGGRAICMGPRNYLARGYQGIPIAITVEGANILTRSLIIFGQGAIRCHPYVLREMNAALCEDPHRGLAEFDRALFAHVGFTVSNAVRALVLGLTFGRLTPAPVPGVVGHYYRQLSRMSAALAVVADACMLAFGGRLKRLERLSARLGDVLSHLYLASAALKRFEDDGRPEVDRPLLHWACRDALHRIQTALDELFRNMPYRSLGAALRWLVFPLGLPYVPPNDANDRRVARALLRPGPARDRLTRGIFVGSADEPLGRVEHALHETVAAESAARKLRRAVRARRLQADTPGALLTEARLTGVLSHEEVARLEAAAAARREAIQVDAFPPEEFGRISAAAHNTGSPLPLAGEGQGEDLVAPRADPAP